MITVEAFPAASHGTYYVKHVITVEAFPTAITRTSRACAEYLPVYLPRTYHAYLPRTYRVPTTRTYRVPTAYLPWFRVPTAYLPAYLPTVPAAYLPRTYLWTYNDTRTATYYVAYHVTYTCCICSRVVASGALPSQLRLSQP